MIKIVNKQDCCGCSACNNICPKNAVKMEEDDEGFRYPKVDLSLCVNCGLSERVCPVINKNEHKDEVRLAYAAYNKNEEIRLNSSSGGVFSLLSEYVLKQGGCVFGAAYNDKFEVVHKKIEKPEELNELRGSKYTQSAIGDTYSRAKEELKRGRLVLFTGTPCQIGGLKAYLGKEYENLITQDLICHGVPTPKLWKDYVAYRERISGSPARRTFSRHKFYGWKRYSVLFKFSNNTEYRAPLTDDIYMKAFLRNLCLRPSCYSCAFKSKDRVSDITLADFWGIQNVIPDMDDDKGTSLVVIHSEKGQRIFEKIKKNLTYKETDLEQAIIYNKSMIKSVEKPKKREKFFNVYKNMRGGVSLPRLYAL